MNRKVPSALPLGALSNNPALAKELRAKAIKLRKPNGDKDGLHIHEVAELVGVNCTTMTRWLKGIPNYIPPPIPAADDTETLVWSTRQPAGKAFHSRRKCLAIIDAPEERVRTSTAEIAITYRTRKPCVHCWQH